MNVAFKKLFIEKGERKKTREGERKGEGRAGRREEGREIMST